MGAAKKKAVAVSWAGVDWTQTDAYLARLLGQEIETVEKERDRAAGVQWLRLDAIVVDHDLQPRLRLDPATVIKYMDAMIEGRRLPPVVVFCEVGGPSEASTYRLADGFHRVEAARRWHGGPMDIRAEVRFGDRRAALHHAVGANAHHGLPRSNEDKRRCVELLFRDLGRDAKDREIARIAAVDHRFVGAVRADLGYHREGSPVDAGDAASGDPLPLPTIADWRGLPMSLLHQVCQVMQRLRVAFPGAGGRVRLETPTGFVALQARPDGQLYDYDLVAEGDGGPFGMTYVGGTMRKTPTTKVLRSIVAPGAEVQVKITAPPPPPPRCEICDAEAPEGEPIGKYDPRGDLSIWCALPLLEGEVVHYCPDCVGGVAAEDAAEQAAFAAEQAAAAPTEASPPTLPAAPEAPELRRWRAVHGTKTHLVPAGSQVALCGLAPLSPWIQEPGEKPCPDCQRTGGAPAAAEEPAKKKSKIPAPKVPAPEPSPGVEYNTRAPSERASADSTEPIGVPADLRQTWTVLTSMSESVGAAIDRAYAAWVSARAEILRVHKATGRKPLPGPEMEEMRLAAAGQEKWGEPIGHTLRSVRRELERLTPYKVCPCPPERQGGAPSLAGGGHGKARCLDCDGRGWLSRDGATIAEARAKREG